MKEIKSNIPPVWLKATISGRTLKALKELFTFILKHTKDETPIPLRYTANLALIQPGSRFHVQRPNI